MEEHQNVANSQGISTPTICCYERKVKLTKLHVGFANPESKFKQVMTGFVAARKSTQTKKKPVEENNNQILNSDVGFSNHNEAHKTKLEDEISIDVKPVPKSKAQCVSDFCTKIAGTLGLTLRNWLYVNGNLIFKFCFDGLIVIGNAYIGIQNLIVIFLNRFFLSLSYFSCSYKSGHDLLKFTFGISKSNMKFGQFDFSFITTNCGCGNALGIGNILVFFHINIQNNVIV